MEWAIVLGFLLIICVIFLAICKVLDLPRYTSQEEADKATCWRLRQQGELNEYQIKKFMGKGYYPPGE